MYEIVTKRNKFMNIIRNHFILCKFYIHENNHGLWLLTLKKTYSYIYKMPIDRHIRNSLGNNFEYNTTNKQK